MEHQSRPKILVCDDDPLYHQTIQPLLAGAGYECISVLTPGQLLQILTRQAIQLVLMDIHLSEPGEGLRWISQLRELDPELAIIVISGSSDYRTVRDALLRGASDYFVKDGEPEEILRIIHRTHERQNLLKRQSQHRFESQMQQKSYSLIGQSQAIRTLRRVIEKVAASQANVIILGETGTGKEVVARQLRRQGADGSFCPFVSVDSSTIQPSMAESILFGHEKGAFTGADRKARGIFEEAQGGIVYFDEIGNMSLEIQAKLLRVLQEKEITRLGSSRLISLDFRVVCASNEDLEELVRQGRFKADLFQRLNVIPIVVPPLRDHLEDIPALIHYFSTTKSTRHSSSQMLSLEFSEEAEEALRRYPWPGNVRELSNLVAYLSALAESCRIEIQDLPPRFFSAVPRLAEPSFSAKVAGYTERSHSLNPESTGVTTSLEEPGLLQTEGKATVPYYDKIARFEQTTLQFEYRRFRGNISRMAEALSMDRSYLHTKLKNLGIHQLKSKKSIAV